MKVASLMEVIAAWISTKKIPNFARIVPALAVRQQKNSPINIPTANFTFIVFGRNYSSFIEETKNALTVFELESPEGFQNLYTVHKLIQEVRSAEVCSLLCTEKETLTMTSGWLYISLNNVCNCIVVNEQLCGDEIGTVLTQQQILNMDAFQNSTLLFVNSSTVNIRTNCRGKDQQ